MAMVRPYRLTPLSAKPCILPYGTEGSEYRVSAFIEPQSGQGKARIRLSWSDSGSLDDAYAPVESGNVFANWDAIVRSVDIKQPADAKYLHIEYLTEGSGTFVFGNTALQSFGALHSSANDDIGSGSESFNFYLSGGDTSWQSVERRFDISDDPDGTRYLIRFNVSEGNQRKLTGAKFEVKFDIETRRVRLTQARTLRGIGAMLALLMMVPPKR